MRIRLDYVVDPNWFQCDPYTDPDRAFFVNADQDTDPRSRVLMTKPCEKFTAEKNSYCFDKKLLFTYP
jgi:hypothetical protein